jgi:hypothetical protein
MRIPVLPKLLFYVSYDQLSAWEYRHGVLHPGPVLRATPDGLAQFAAWLGERQDIPAWVIADLVEEDFQRQTLPHVRGRAGRNLVERRLNQLFRDTPFRHATLQDREPAGRRDDHALFSALTNPALVQPWMTVMEGCATPLAAVYSAAHLCTQLARRLALAQPHLLLITEQAGGLRQSYFQGAHLKFSRLTVLDPGEDIIAATAREAQRMQQFLTSTRLLERGGMLQVTIVAPDQRLAALEQACEDDPETSFHFVGLDAAAGVFKLVQTPADCAGLLLQLVARHPPPSQYALPSPRRFYRIWQGRLGLNGASAAVVLGGALWLLGDVWGMVGANGQAERLRADAARDDARYRVAMASFPASAVKSADMKAAVMLDRQLGGHAPAPDQMAALVSRALGSAPAVRLMVFDWQAGAQTGTAAAHGPGQDDVQLAGSGRTIEPIPAALIGVPDAPPQSLRIEGEVDLPQSEYRAIVASIQQFAFEMARNPGVAVEILESPVDVRQNVTLSGRTGGHEGGAKPRFVARITWKP